MEEILPPFCCVRFYFSLSSLDFGASFPNPLLTTQLWEVLDFSFKSWFFGESVKRHKAFGYKLLFQRHMVFSPAVQCHNKNGFLVSLSLLLGRFRN